jgi:hypothetical protein
MLGHLIIAIAISAAVIGAGIYLESMRRHSRATKIAERERRRRQDRRGSGERPHVTEQRQAKRRHRSRHRSHRRDG